VTHVFWGRRRNERGVCPTPYYEELDNNLECSIGNGWEDELFEKIKRECNGRTECLFVSPMWFLRNPCPDLEISKYLDITYDCMGAGK